MLRVVSLLLASLVERPASLLDSRPAGRLLDLTPRDGDEDDDFWSMDVDDTPDQQFTDGWHCLVRLSVDSRHKAVWAATIDALPFLSGCEFGAAFRGSAKLTWA